MSGAKLGNQNGRGNKGQIRGPMSSDHRNKIGNALLGNINGLGQSNSQELPTRFLFTKL